MPQFPQRWVELGPIWSAQPGAKGGFIGRRECQPALARRHQRQCQRARPRSTGFVRRQPISGTGVGGQTVLHHTIQT